MLNKLTVSPAGYRQPRLTLLSPDDMHRVHAASLQILSETGIVFHHDEALGIFARHGARVDGRVVRLTPEMVEAAMAGCPRQFEWRGRDAQKSIVLGNGSGPWAQGPSGCLYIQQIDGSRRRGLMADYVDAQKLMQACRGIDVVGGYPVEPSDIPLEQRHLFRMAAILKHTDKPIHGLPTSGKRVRETFDMLAITIGGKRRLCEHHWIGTGINSLSPLAYSDESTASLLEYARNNQPVFPSPAAIAGVTAPIKPFGAIALQNAEILAAIVLAQLVNPGNPVVYSAASAMGDMRRATYCTGSPETIFITLGGCRWVPASIVSPPAPCPATPNPSSPITRPALRAQWPSRSKVSPGSTPTTSLEPSTVI